MTGISLLEVTEIIEGLAANGIKVWVDGGWCVDALVGKELRDHHDLDIAVSRADEAALRAWFAAGGYDPRPSNHESAWNFVLGLQDRVVDVHVFEFDEHGTHIYGVEYPAASLTGHASLGGLDVRCIAPEWMFRFKTAYDPAPKDIRDVRALAEKFGFVVPVSHLQ